ncbi:FecR family protein [Prolixibacteraceae bacterium JC049]|nr:FecR family protein [Prolixibacteraceae bacterium JC049]
MKDIFDRTKGEEEKKQFYSNLKGAEREEYIQRKNLDFFLSLSSAKYPKEKKDILYQSIENRLFATRKLHKTSWKNTFVKYAAIVVFAICVGGWLSQLFFNNGSADRYMIKADKGSIAYTELEDGSKIWLNADTELNIVTCSDGKIVAHLDGEAFFDLIPNAERDFTVDVGNILIRDIGTKFNVNAYSEHRRIQTTLIEGKIEIYNRSGRKLVALSPGEMAQYGRKKKLMRIINTDVESAMAWRDGKLVFLNRTLGSIAHELEKWYDVDIQFENPKLRFEVFSCIVKRTTTIEPVMEMLKISAQIDYELIEHVDKKDEIIIK